MTKILVVDDKPRNRKEMLAASRGEGREVIEAETEAEAIAQIRDRDFDLVITDIVMESDTSGFNVLHAAKQKDVHTQVIVVTSFGGDEVGVRAMIDGAFDYIERREYGQSLKRKIELALKFREALLARDFSNERR